jgi:hypothetical protein
MLPAVRFGASCGSVTANGYQNADKWTSERKTISYLQQWTQNLCVEAMVQIAADAKSRLAASNAI